MFRCKACGVEGDFHMYDVMNKGLLVPLCDPYNEKRLKQIANVPFMPNKVRKRDRIREIFDEVKNAPAQEEKRGLDQFLESDQSDLK